MRDDLEAEFAEVLVSPSFREAASTAFLRDTETYADVQRSAEQIVIDSLTAYRNPDERAYEARRLAALADLNGENLGPFNDYFLTIGGNSTPTELTVEDLDKGDAEVVRTNSKLIGLEQVHVDPIEFLSGALSTINSRKRTGKQNVGPENYATALKFFTDKFNDFPSTNLDKKTVRDEVRMAMDGFLFIAQKDKPNFVEMTNLYVAMRDLPRGSFDKKHTVPILRHSLEQLPTYNQKTLSVMLGALAKLDLTPAGEASAVLVDLTMRKMKSFETTTDMRRSIRAIANLPATLAANQAFRTFLEVRNNLEQPLDVNGIDELNERLLTIVESVIDDLELIPEAKDLAFNSAQRAVAIYQTQKNRGSLTVSQIGDLKAIVDRIVKNFNAM